jgi:hypothetical protein
VFVLIIYTTATVLSATLTGTDQPLAFVSQTTTTTSSSTATTTSTVTISDPNVTPASTTPIVICPVVDCKTTCGTDVSYTTYRDSNGCKQCVCNTVHCGNCTNVQCNSGLVSTPINDDGIPSCLCQNCKNPDCDYQCDGGFYSVVSDGKGCKKCNCLGRVPCAATVTNGPCPNLYCKDQCQSAYSFQYDKDDSCTECLCLKNYEYCANCTCSNTYVTQNVNIDKFVVTKKFVPYTVYFDPQSVDSVDAAFQTKFDTNYGIQKQFNYLIFISKQTSNYRKVLINLRAVLQSLLLSGDIAQQQFEEYDSEATTKLNELEAAIASQTVTLSQLIKDTDEVRQLISELGFENNAAPVCVLIGGQMECDLKPAYLNQLSSSYLQDNLLTRTIYTKIPTKVTNIVSKQGNTVTIRRNGVTWEIKTISINPVVESKIWELALTFLLQNNTDVRTVVGAVIGQVLHEDTDWYQIVKHIMQLPDQLADIQQELLHEYASVTTDALRTAMINPEVLQLGQTNKPSVETETLPSRVTEEVIRLPLDVIKLEDSVLIDLLSQKLELNF